jgi:hypothetical protein
MKKKKTQKSKLSFEKLTVLELNELKTINGGQIPPDRTVTDSAVGGDNGYSTHCG